MIHFISSTNRKPAGTKLSLSLVCAANSRNHRNWQRTQPNKTKCCTTVHTLLVPAILVWHTYIYTRYDFRYSVKTRRTILHRSFDYARTASLPICASRIHDIVESARFRHQQQLLPTTSSSPRRPVSWLGREGKWSPERAPPDEALAQPLVRRCLRGTSKTKKMGQRKAPKGVQLSTGNGPEASGNAPDRNRKHSSMNNKNSPDQQPSTW